MGSTHSSLVLACLTVTDMGVIVNMPVFENNLWAQSRGWDEEAVKPRNSLGEVITSFSTHVSTQVGLCYLMLLLQPHYFILQFSLKSYSQKVIWGSKYLSKMYNYLQKTSVMFLQEELISFSSMLLH